MSSNRENELGAGIFEILQNRAYLYRGADSFANKLIDELCDLLLRLSDEEAVLVKTELDKLGRGDSR